MGHVSEKVFGLLASALSLCTCAHSQTTDLKVDYTGSLLGYYRMEPSETTHLTPVSNFLENRAQRSTTLLVGMGDNFGPEFGASLQNVNSADPNCMLPPIARGDGKKMLIAPESLYKDDDRLTPSNHNGKATPACDNVMNFLMQAGYRVVVPGREDFMYTATWLRHAALLLQQVSVQNSQPRVVNNVDGQLHLLSANLRLSIDYSRKLRSSDPAQGGEYSLKGHCPLLFDSDALASDTTRCGGNNTETDELKWLGRLDRLVRRPKRADTSGRQKLTADPTPDEAIQAYLDNNESGQESLLGDQVNILLTAWKPLLGKEVTPWSLKPRSQAPEIDKALADKIDQLNHMLSDPCHAKVDQAKCPPADPGDIADLLVYANELLIRLQNVQSIRAKQANASQFSLSEAARLSAMRGLLRRIAHEQDEVGYTLTEKGPGPKTLIIGVMGGNTFAAVSHVNRILCMRSGAAGGPPSAWPSDFSSCKSNVGDTPQTSSVAVGSVVVTDPVAIVDAIVRGVQLLHPDVGAIIVMAQMPHTDAEVLSMKLQTLLSSAPMSGSGELHTVDLVLSEAEPGYATGDVSLQYGRGVASASGAGTGNSEGFAYPAPVLTPELSYSAKEQSLPGTVSSATLTHLQKAQYTVTNQRPERLKFPGKPIDTAACLLQVASELRVSGGKGKVTPCTQDESEANTATTRQETGAVELRLMKILQSAEKTAPDVTILEARDLQFDSAPAEYLTYDVCDSQTALDPKSYAICVIHVGLDRIFWKGDYMERVAIKGADLKLMIEKSDSYLNEESELADRDITGQWLVSFGITQPALANVTDISRADQPLWIPSDPNCKAASRAGTYCVGGIPLVDDQYYWLVTSDSLAQDPNVYGILAKLDAKQHEQTSDFLTGKMAKGLVASVLDGSECVLSPCGKSAQQVITENNLAFEQRRLVQVDFAKAVAGFSSRSPVGGNQFVGSYYQGVADSRATAPSSQELDLELASRVTSNVFGQHFEGRVPKSFSLGLQSTFAYDRAVIGNLSPATKPINGSYALNNFAVGAFIQFRLGTKKNGNPVSVRSLPRTLVVLAPRQYQTQINHQYLFFSFANSSPLPGELTVKQPRASGYSDKAGLRREFGQEGPKPLFGAGNYIEFGGEFVTQKNVLAAVTLANGAISKTCQVSSSITLQTCFSQAPTFTITSNTTIPKPPTVNDLNTPGLYWAIHLQNHLGTKGMWNKMSLSTDVQGDFYFGRPTSAELPTQTEYAIPVSVALMFPSIGNLSFGPTYSGFFYKSQLSTQSLQVNSYSITAKWYFSRDNSVPIKRQIRLPGPTSADQTKTARVH